MKKCTKCLSEKPLSEFHNCASRPDGKFSACKQCRNSYNKAKAAEIGYDVLYQRALQSKGEAAYRARTKAYYDKNQDAIRAKSRAWNAENKDRKAAAQKKHYELNRKAYIDRVAKWAKENRERRSEICLAYIDRIKRERPNEYATTETARKMIARVLASTGRKKRGRTFEILGYNRHDLERHNEERFEPGMSWENHGEWHIDHIVPVSELVRCGVKDPAKINALSNLRPLWAAENMAKRDRFELAPPENSSITRRRS